jgi:hypothetical protein
MDIEQDQDGDGDWDAHTDPITKRTRDETHERMRCYSFDRCSENAAFVRSGNRIIIVADILLILPRASFRRTLWDHVRYLYKLNLCSSRDIESRRCNCYTLEQNRENLTILFHCYTTREQSRESDPLVGNMLVYCIARAVTARPTPNPHTRMNETLQGE